MKRFKFLSMLVVLALMLSAFAPSAVRAQAAPQTIVEIASGSSNFSTLVAAVQAAGLVETLNGTGPFTVFAPTDAAFAKLGQKMIDSLLADPEALKQVLLYHVVPGKLMAADVTGAASAATAAELPVAFSMRGANVFVNDARITSADIEASNGVIHVIDSVIVPPSLDIVDTLAGRSNFKTLVAAVQAAGLVDTLKGDGPFTIFAPTDAAFSKLGSRAINDLLKDPEALKNVLLYHAYSGAVTYGDALKLSSANMVSGQDVVFSMRGASLMVNNARVITYNILTTNGVIHVIDTVLLPPSKDIVDTLAGNTNFETLVAAVQAAGLVDTLKGEGPFTIFAPTDAAFAKLPAGTVEALIADPETLKSILLYHAASGSVYSGDVVKLARAATVNGADVSISLRNGSVYVNNARVTVTDIRTTNGVIHVIDTVILPPAGDIVAAAAANPRLKTLVAAVQAAGLVETLQGEGPFTIFAPTDAAFAKLPAGTIPALLADPESLKGILLYHAVEGSVFSGEAAALTSAKTINGAEIAISGKNGVLYINNVRVVTENIQVGNGVIHIIDSVILPPAQ